MVNRKIDGLTEDEFDTLVLVLGLVKEGWSYRKIGRVLNADDHKVKSLYDKALQLKEEGNLRKNATREGVVDIVYVGDSNDLEGIERGIIERQSGRRPTRHKATDY